MILLSHPTSNLNSSAAARGLYKHGLLTAYYTCISWNPDTLLAQCLPGQLTRWLNRRKQIAIPAELIKTRPLREYIRNFCELTGIYGTGTREDAFFSTERIYCDLDRHIARQLKKYPNLRGVYAYDDGALAHFRQAQKMGLQRIYDLPIGHWRVLKEITIEESEAQPAWRGTMKSLTDSAAKYERKDAEIELADVVIAASTFTRQTLQRFPMTKQVIVVPYGMPEVTAPPRPATNPDNPLRVLFVGALTQRKGISYLFDAMKMLGKAATLTVIGRRDGQAKALDEACARHRWLETLSNPEVLQEMQQHDVLAFPSLFEGFGLVIGEALSQGLPVITTANTGAPDILRDGVEGFIIPIRSAQAIADKLQLLHGDRELLKHMSDSARARAKRETWDLYEDRVAQAAAEALGIASLPGSTQQVNGTAGGVVLGQEFIRRGIQTRR
jgi:starch synthase